jgi:hypothetical protein
VCPRAGLDRRKISSPPGFDPGPSSSLRFLIFDNVISGCWLGLICLSEYCLIVEVSLFRTKSLLKLHQIIVLTVGSFHVHITYTLPAAL